ncbi:SusD/RagB family nutrient-binding outer membrane lipoprotein [Sphingobacterium sp. GVS05A]|uniref:SusD/RagB family nutrient-binding outer membrane lipoprotein n=1 Tax=Sphingobacterium TaxID=28453 RepID=UPI001CBC53B5|nr:SusD/RagB family nutrient-binding outer membrane lipoprotein [Sphingobacterium sp. GVS05A]
MKNKVKLLYALCFTAIVGCKTGDDLYISPNNPLDGNLPSMLTAAEVNTFQNVEGDLSRMSSILVQHSVGLNAQYSDVQNYRITQGDFDNVWIGLYTNTMYNLKLMIDKAKIAETKSPYYEGIAKVMMALNISLATDLWGDVPYSEAFQWTTGNKTPKLDSQQDVYKSIDNLLADAITDLSVAEDENYYLPAEDDLIFKGDTEKWVKAAYTLRARFLNRTSSKQAGTETKVLDYLKKGISSNDENMIAPHDENSQNQWGAFQAARRGYLGASNLFVDRLSAKNDPRLAYFLRPNSKKQFIGGDITKESITPDISVVGPFFAADQNFPIITYYEAKFIEAEVKQRQGTNASAILNEAIKANVEYITSGKESASGVANYASATKTDILTEKWVALYNQGIEPYNDYRRTGIPTLTPRPQSVGATLPIIPKRYPFPQTTTLYNPNAKNIPMDVAVWWGM